MQKQVRRGSTSGGPGDCTPACATLPPDLRLFLRGQELFQRNPDSYNGAVRDNYTWSQDYTDLELKVPVPQHVLKGRQVTAPPALGPRGASPALRPGPPAATGPAALCRVCGAGHLLVAMVLWRPASAGDAARWGGSRARVGPGAVTVASGSSRSLVGGRSPGKPL